MTVRGSLFAAVGAFAFGAALALADIYPYAVAEWLLLGGFVFHLGVGRWITTHRMRRLWVAHGFATLGLILTLQFWHFRLHGVWFPEPPRILQRFVHVDGESGHDAMVSNWFIVSVPLLTLVLLGVTAWRSSATHARSNTG